MDDFENIFDEFNMFKILYFIAAIIIVVVVIVTIVVSIRRQIRRSKNKPAAAPPPPIPQPQIKVNTGIDPFDLSETAATTTSGDSPFTFSENDSGTNATFAAMAITAMAMQNSQQQQAPTEINEMGGFCPFCGAPREEGKFCPFCGNKFES